MAKGQFTVPRGSAQFGKTQFGDGFGLAFNPEKNALGFVQVHRPTLVQISAWLRAATPADPAIRDWLADLFWGGINRIPRLELRPGRGKRPIIDWDLVRKIHGLQALGDSEKAISQELAALPPPQEKRIREMAAHDWGFVALERALFATNLPPAPFISKQIRENGAVDARIGARLAGMIDAGLAGQVPALVIVRENRNADADHLAIIEMLADRIRHPEAGIPAWSEDTEASEAAAIDALLKIRPDLHRRTIKNAWARRPASLWKK